MRLYVVSLIVALACLFPQFAEIRGWDVPNWARLALMIPSAGLGYMEVFFHELGHTVASWTFGEVAVPSFNFEDGGGVSVPLLPRSLILEGIVYLAAIGFAYWLVTAELYVPAGALAVFLAVHAWFSIGPERYHIVVSYMGHGGSVLVGCFCLLRAALNKTVSESSPELERYLNMTFGMFVVLSNIMLSWKIVTDPMSRRTYEAGIGGHLTNDFVVIANYADTTLNRVCLFSLGFIACSLLVSLGLFLYLRQVEEETVDVGPIVKRRRL